MNKSQSQNTLIRKITALFVIGFVVSAMFGFTLPKLQSATAASAPNITSYQGRILNSNGVPVTDASLSMKFEFYTAASGGTCLWSNSSVDCDSDTPASTTARTVTLTGGLFSELLGDTTDASPYAAIGDSIFGDNASVYLQVYIGGETLSPRKEIAAVPYALNSDTLDGNDTSFFLAAGGDTATGDHDYTGAIFMGASPMVFEGASDDTFQTTFAITDPSGSSKTITFKNETGTVALLSDVGGGLFTDGGAVSYLTSATDDFAIGGTATATSPFAVDESANSIYVGEGSNSSGNIIFKASDADTGTLTYGTGDSFDFTGGNITTDSDLTVSGGDIVLGTSSIFSGGDVAQLNNVDALDATTETTIESAIDTLDALTVTGASDFSSAELAGTTALTFEGSSVDTVETIFSITNPTTSDKTITFKDETGTVAFLSDVTGGLFTDGGAVSYLTSATDDFAIGGTATTASPFAVDESANSIYVGEGSTADGNIIFKASDADTGTLTYTTSDTFAFTGGAISSDSTITASDFSCTDCLDFAEFEDTLDLDAAMTLNQGANAWTQNYTGTATGYSYVADSVTSGNAVLISADALTLGDALGVASTSNTRSSGDVLQLSHSGTTYGATTVSGSILDLTQAITNNTGTLTTISGDTMFVNRTTTSNNAATTINLTGSVLDLSNTGTLGSGSLNDSSDMVKFTQNYENATGDVVFIDNGGSGRALDILQDDASTTSAAVYVDNDGIASGLHIEQDGSTTSTGPSTTASAGLSINNSSNSNMGLSVFSTNSVTTAPLTYFYSDDTLFDNEILYVRGNSAAADAMHILQDNALSTGAGLYLDNDGTASGIHIEQDGDTTSTIPGATATAALSINNTTNDRIGLSLYSLNSAPLTPLAYFNFASTSAAQQVMYLDQNGVASALHVEMDGDIATGAPSATTGGAIHVNNTSNDGMGLSVFSSNTTETDPLAYLYASAATFDEELLYLRQNGTGSALHIEMAGDTGDTLPTATTAAGLSINNSANDGMALSIFTNQGADAAGPLAYIRAFTATFDEELFRIDNHSGTPSMLIDANADTGSTISDAVGGALHITNTGNSDHGLTVYSNDSFPNQALVKFEVGSNFDEEIVEIVGTDSSVVGLFVNEDAGNTQAGTYASQGIYIDTDATTGRLFGIESDADSADREVFRVDVDGSTAIGQGGLCLDNDGSCSGAISGQIYYLAASVGASDIAEIYTSNEALVAGDIVAIDPASLSGGVKRSTQAYEQGSISVIATKPAILMGAPTDEELIAEGIDPGGDPNWGNHAILAGTYPVTLAGRVPAKVNTENGNIAVGDLITTSSAAGVGMKSTKPGAVVGRALEAWNGPGQGVIEVYILSGWHSGGTIATDGAVGTFNNNFAFTSIGAATAGTQGQASNSLMFRGSGWDGAVAQDVDMVLSTDVTDSSNYKLSVKNDAGTEVAYVNQDGDLALSGRLYPSDEGTLQTDKYIYYESGGDYMRTNAAGWATGSYDFAEMFPSLDALNPGEVVVFAADNEHVARSTGETYDRKIVGIVSTRPGFLAGENIDGHVPIALAGRVPTFVTNENGAIAPGDPLTTSSKPGYAMKATEAGPIIGYAMEPFNSEAGSVITFVRSSYYDGGQVTEAPAADNVASGVTSTSSLDVSGTLNLNGGNIINVSSITGIGNRWTIKDNGDFVTEGRIAHLVNSYQNEDVETYAALTRETTIQLSGTATLQDGGAAINFEDIDPEFNDIISNEHTYRVFLTASQPTGALYAVNRTNTGFSIRESGGTSNAVVDWMVIAYHKDYAPEIIVEDNIAEPEPVVDPVVDPVIDPVEEPVSDPVLDPATEPAIDPVVDPVTEPATDPIVDPAPDPVVDPDPPVIPLPDPEPEPDPVSEPDPVVDPAI